MQLRHVSTHLRQSLRRNLSMHAAVVITLFVSLTLAGVGVLLSQQAALTTEVIGNELQITVTLCVPDDPENPQCTGEVTAEQEAEILRTIEENPEVESVEVISKEQGLENLRATGSFPEEQFEGPDPLITADILPKAIRITLVDPDEFAGVTSAIENLDGVRDITTAKELVGDVFTVIDILRISAWATAGALIIAAVLLVANTIRLTALARRKEIEIMRLVGASRLFIVLPFVLEALFTAVLGVALSAGALAAFTKWAVIDYLAESFAALPFVGWSDFAYSVAVIAVIGPLLTVLPTLLMTRKYLRF
jgi:cell division transport system permease protein